ncbi:MAG: hypothetical protein J2P17_08195, partial [Mycobacterium sp.]|nr:hypothetical protein [Mycobacterium sp.]
MGTTAITTPWSTQARTVVQAADRALVSMAVLVGPAAPARHSYRSPLLRRWRRSTRSVQLRPANGAAI